MYIYIHTDETTLNLRCLNDPKYPTYYFPNIPKSKFKVNFAISKVNSIPTLTYRFIVDEEV